MFRSPYFLARYFAARMFGSEPLLQRIHIAAVGTFQSGTTASQGFQSGAVAVQGFQSGTVATSTWCEPA